MKPLPLLTALPLLATPSVLAHIDTTHFLGFGYHASEVAATVSGDGFWRPTTRGANAALFPAKTPLTLSGWFWPENTEALLGGTVLAVDEPIGQGHAIVFTQNPIPRPFWQGLNRMLLAAMLFGPGGE